MPDVVVGPLLGVPGLHRQRLRGPVQRLDLGFFVDTEHDRVLRRRQIQPDMSVTFATSSGSVENLNVSAFHGFTPYSSKSRRPWSGHPQPGASSRDDQCVTPSLLGGGSTSPR